ncbi:MAG: MFS transporter [Xanthomonadales bacterium]|nr:MFS transporter [Gammaproteobacteria bacterium]NND56865.1 MFS transporter [Xanthomonadales bacterium]NNK51058.1 MFS transporter [Xanthomonadales bacterium]
MSGGSQFDLFAKRRFMPFFMTQALGAFNDNIFKNALAAMLVFEGSKLFGFNTDQLVNFSAMVFILPFFLFSALFGQLADKYEKSMQIRRVKLFEVVIMLLATLGFWIGSVSLLMFVLFLLGLQSTIFGPIKYGILPQILKREELVGGNALIEMGTFVAILGGTIAGPQLAGVEVSWPYWVSAGCLATAAAGYAASLRIPRADPVAPDLKINWNIFSETVHNLKFINENATVLNSVLGISWFWFFGATFLVQIPSYTQNVLGGDKDLMSSLLALFIIGISAGSLLCEKLSGKQVEIGLVPFGAIGLTLFGLDLYFASPDAPTVGITALEFLSGGDNWRIIIDLLMIGVFGGFYIVPLYALVQSRSAPDHRSRVIAGLNILNALFMVVAAVMAMLILGPAGLGIPDLFLISAILNAVVATYIFTLVPEFLMRFLVWMLIHTIYRVKVTGLDNIPEEGPVIVASNHVSFVDPLILGGMIRRPVNFVMYYKIYRLPLLNFIFRTGKAIPIAGRSEDPEILENAYKRMHGVLAAGDVLGIFPEGRITQDGEISNFKPGIDKVIAEQPVPVVPVALCNLWGSLFSRRDPLHKRRPYKLWSVIELRIGEAIPPEQVSAERLQQEVERLRGDDH